VKVLCLIDSLGSGGAQRQLVSLALGLKKRGHEIRFLVYHHEDHFFQFLHSADIPCQVIPACSYVQRILSIRRILRQGWQDVVLAFLEASSLYAELASIPGREWGLVIGERLADPGMNKGISHWMRQFHRLADGIVCNSYTNQLMLGSAFPFCKRKLFTIYNTVDLKLFKDSSNENKTTDLERASQFRMIIVASYHEKKNMINVAKALLLLRNMQIRTSIVVDWFGAVQPDSNPFKQVEHFIIEHGLGKSLLLHQATRNIEKEYPRADAVGLFSFFEGLPNVICEGMACGKPILLSHVCDAGNLVKDGKNGFLCDPSSPEDIALKIQNMVNLSDYKRKQMGNESRRMAEHLFNEQVVIDSYERILTRASNHESFPPDCSWPKDIPESSLSTFEKWKK